MTKHAAMMLTKTGVKPVMVSSETETLSESSIMVFLSSFVLPCYPLTLAGCGGGCNS